MPRLPLAVAVSLFAVNVHAEVVRDQRWTVESPNGELAFTLRLDAGKLTYTVERGPAAARGVVLQPSPLGLTSSAGRFLDNLRFQGAESPVTVDETYALPHGKHLVNRHHA